MAVITYGIPVEKWPKPGAIVRFFGLRARPNGEQQNLKVKPKTIEQT